MRKSMAYGLIVAGIGVAVASAQPPPQPPGTLLREPYTPRRLVTIVTPPDPAPVELDATGSLDLPYPLESATLALRVRSRHRETLPASGLTVRVALGPLDDSMFSMRMQPQAPADPARAPQPAVPELVRDAWETVTFTRVAADPPLPVLVMKRDLRIVATLERVLDAGGVELWTHPGSREALWKALRAATTEPPR
jgi:hypothetical protein